MKTLSIDIETYSGADLNRTGVYRYAEDPDFEILHPKTRRIIWWEHLGKLADPGYVFENLDRIVVFGRNGIVVGDNLILTWETKEMPLTHGMVDQRLREFGLI